MFIHLGEDVVIRAEDVVAIIDRQLLSIAAVQEFLEGQKKGNNVVDISGNDVKSVVVTVDHIYYSPLSSLTLKRRATEIIEMDLIEE